MSIPYPDKPWEDGQEFEYLLEDGAIVVGTYDEAKNAWNFKRIDVDTSNARPPIFSPTEPEVYPGDNLVDNKLITGDIWYDTSDPNGAVKHVYDGTQWLIDSSEGFQTTATLPLANQPGEVADDPESRARLQAKLDENGVLYQSDLNSEQFYTLFNQRRKGTRDRTRIDFIQNTVLEGDWEFDPAIQNAELPEQGMFNMFKEDGQPTSDYGEVAEIVFNGTDRNNAGTLAETRKGSTLLIFDVILNSFAQFVVDNVSFIGTPNGGQFWAIFHVRVAFGRNVGVVPDGAVCEIKVVSPYPTISSKGTAPVVDNDGYLWYNENNKTLYVSDWDDDQDSNGDAVWIPVGGEGVDTDGSSVHVGEDPPEEVEGALWFDTSRLELYVYYVEDEDGGWLPSSPLGARVSAGEALQQQILNRVNGHDNALDDLYANQADFLRNQISNDVTTSFRIKSGGKTLLSTSGNVLSLYNLNEPTNPTHAATAGYVDRHIGPTWKWIVDGSSLTTQRQAIRWYTSDNITMNFYVHGITLTGPEYEFSGGHKSDGNDPRELMSIYGPNSEGKMKHIMVAPVRNWEFGSGYIAFRCNVADMRIWDPTGLENETPVFFKYGAFF